jgi:hypothetical protein
LFVEAAITLSAALVGVAMVLPWADRLTQRRRWASDGLAAGVKASHDHGPPAFQPLDLGEDPMKWPSEVIRPDTAQKIMPWPSETWDDPHFGRHAQRAQVATDAASAFEEARVEEKATRQRERDERDERASTAPGPARPVKKPRRPKPQVPTANPFAGAAAATREVFTPAQLERLVASQGLAGAVQTIMAQTGWDFRKAAQYLANHRRPE